MTRTLYLHIGPLKTGSTALQAFFRENAEVFRRQGLYWPVTGTEINGNYHRGLVPAFIPGHATAPRVNKLEDELRAQGLPAKVLLTAEMFAARFADPAYLGSLKSFCQRLGYDLHIIAVIRPQVPLLNSLFTQHVKIWRPAVLIETFLEQEVASGRHHYATLFSQILNDREIRFTALPFNQASLSQGLNRSLCGVMQLDDEASGIRDIVTVNTSPGPRTVAAFQHLRLRSATDFPRLDSERLAALTWPILRASDAMGWNTGKFGGFDTGQKERTVEHFAAENEAFARVAWARPWTHVFTADESLDPPYNVFDPKTASPPDRESFQSFVDEAFDTIAEFAATTHR